MPANNSSTHHYLLIFKSQFYVNNKQIHLEADPSAHRLHRHSHRHHPRRHQLHGHVMTIAAGINHDARPFVVICHSYPFHFRMTQLELHRKQTEAVCFAFCCSLSQIIFCEIISDKDNANRVQKHQACLSVMPKYRANESRAKHTWAMPSAADIQRC